MPELLDREQLLLVISVYEKGGWMVNMKAIPGTTAGPLTLWEMYVLWDMKTLPPNMGVKKAELSFSNHLCNSRAWQLVRVCSKKTQNYVPASFTAVFPAHSRCLVNTR